jgi:arylsulfatase
VVDNLPGDAPHAFTGGRVVRVAIDVSGEAFVDLAAEAKAAFARQ